MTAQEHGFKAEVQQLLDLMIHSLYSHKEIFLRELISNAADALDKVRFLELTRVDLTNAATDEPGIRITVDEDAGIIVIEDDGIGMTHDEVVNNLGTIARSGSKAFLAELAESADEGKPSTPDLIGQFGVGFYSSFMVATSVQVETLSALPEAEPVLWTSEGRGSYTIDKGSRTARGTRITIQLRDEEKLEYASAGRLTTIVRKHSNFLAWPVFVGEEQANQARAIWHENPSNVQDDDYNEFFRALAQDWTNPDWRLHVSIDSPIQYKALLFIPGRPPYDLFRPESQFGPRLYAKRVLINEHAEDLFPRWLRFIKGVIDSEDIQLNVSREMVQQTPVVRKIRDMLVKRLLKDLGKLAKSDDEDKANLFTGIWRNFGVPFKEGYLQSPEYKDKILPLLRFNALSHDSEDGLMSLAEYKAAMPEGQEAIYYIPALNRDAAVGSPALEILRNKGYDVLLLTDTIDEWLVQAIATFDEVPLKSATQGDLDLGDRDDADDGELGDLVPWMKDVFGVELSDVRTSGRLVDSPAVLVDADGISSNQERILRAANEPVMMTAKRVLELNPKHAVVRNIERLRASGNTEEAEPLARLLLDDALLLEGTVKDPAAIGRRLQALLERSAEAALGGEEATA